MTKTNRMKEAPSKSKRLHLARWLAALDRDFPVGAWHAMHGEGNPAASLRLMGFGAVSSCIFLHN